jgi:hypothetical protein
LAAFSLFLKKANNVEKVNPYMFPFYTLTSHQLRKDTLQLVMFLKNTKQKYRKIVNSSSLSATHNETSYIKKFKLSAP